MISVHSWATNPPLQEFPFQYELPDLVPGLNGFYTHNSHLLSIDNMRRGKIDLQIVPSRSSSSKVLQMGITNFGGIIPAMSICLEITGTVRHA